MRLAAMPLRVGAALLMSLAAVQSTTTALAQQIHVNEAGGMQVDGSAAPSGTIQSSVTYGPVLTFSLPFPGNPGDIILNESVTSALSDVISFPGDGTMRYMSLAQRQSMMSAAAAVGATNIKIQQTNNYHVGDQMFVDLGGSNPERVSITAVGTSGASGTGINITPPLSFAHATGAGTSESLKLADVPSLSSLVEPHVTLTEAGSPGTIWIPGSTGIGGDANFPSVQYLFQGDVVPEPAAASLAGLAIAMLLIRRRRCSLSS